MDVVHYPSQLKIKLDLDVNECVRYRQSTRTHTQESTRATNEEQIKNDVKISQTRTRQRDQHVQPRFFVNKHPVDAIHERFGFHVVKEPRDATFVARVGVILGVVILSL